MRTLTVALLGLLIGVSVSAGQSTQRFPEALNITTIEQVRAQVSQSPSIPSFVRWLRQRSDVSNIDYEPGTFLTSYPPQQSVRFSVEGQRYRILLRSEQDARITLVSEERSPVPRR